MNKRDFVRAGAFGSLALGAASAAQAQSGGPSYQWKMATGWPGGPLMDVGAKLFAERMEQFSGGRFKIQTFPGGAIGNALKVPETVKNGLAECGHTWMGYDWGKDPTTVLFGGYAVYFPELFPTRLRSTGTGFCYNVARFIAASAPWTLGLLIAPLGLRGAVLALSGIFLLALLVLPFAPETRGKSLMD